MEDRLFNRPLDFDCKVPDARRTIHFAQLGRTSLSQLMRGRFSKGDVDQLVCFPAMCAMRRSLRMRRSWMGANDCFARAASILAMLSEPAAFLPDCAVRSDRGGRPFRHDSIYKYTACPIPLVAASLRTRISKTKSRIQATEFRSFSDKLCIYRLRVRQQLHFLGASYDSQQQSSGLRCRTRAK